MEVAPTPPDEAHRLQSLRRLKILDTAPEVAFEDLLAKALDANGQEDLNELEPEIFRPENTPVKVNGNDVNLETEVGQMVKNTLRHKTYIRLLQKKYNQIELAMNTK